MIFQSNATENGNDNPAGPVGNGLISPLLIIGYRALDLSFDKLLYNWVIRRNDLFG